MEIKPVSSDPLSTWHELVRCGDFAKLDALLADEVVFYSPIVHTAQRGKLIAAQYLTAALKVFANESFEYVRELKGARDAVLEFRVVIDGIEVNGVDMIHWNDKGCITEFKVMLRPLKAINLIHQKMGAMLQVGQSQRP